MGGVVQSGVKALPPVPSVLPSLYTSLTFASVLSFLLHIHHNICCEIWCFQGRWWADRFNRKTLSSQLLSRASIVSGLRICRETF